MMLLLLLFFSLLSPTLLLCTNTYPYTPRAYNPPKYLSINWIRKIIDNFHTVEPGQLYRCGQLAPIRLLKYVKKLNIKTIINLRGTNKHTLWWQAEEDMASQHNIKFYNVALSAHFYPEKEKLLTLLRLYQRAPRPILIHCYGGADRTGEAAGLWVLAQQKKGNQVALNQLSFLKYRYMRSKHPAKYDFIKQWKDKAWLKHVYDPKKIDPNIHT